MILSCNNISKSFDDTSIISNCSFVINEGEKAAIVGINGAGKSTLLKIIVGELAADDGTVVISKGKTIGYLSQHQDINNNNTIYQEMLSVKQHIIDMEERIRTMEQQMNGLEGDALTAHMNSYTNLVHTFEALDGYSYKSEINGVLNGLSFKEDEHNALVSTLSGGQRTRVALCKLLLSKPDIILLDEPTNHLDIASITWLEDFLRNYKGTVIIVAHDRFFLDRIVTKVIEIDMSNVLVFSGNYSDYSSKKAMLRDNLMKAYLNQQREIKHQQEVIDKLKSFNREKSIKRAESREKMLDKIEVLDKPTTANSNMRIMLTPQKISGNDVLDVCGLTKSYDNLLLFNNVNFQVKRGEKVAIIGANGTGKTTILKIINQLVTPDKGDVKLGTNVEIGYYDQEHNVLNMEKSIFDEISDAYPYLTNTEIRNVLAAFLFTGDDVFKLIGDLSGGERGRVSLAKLMLSNANFLILDEPTNHLDIESKEILENAINSYEGTVLYVSHDRYFINKTSTRILDLEGQTLTNYIGNYDYYLEKHPVLAPVATTVASQENVSVSDNSGKKDWQAMKEEQAMLRKRQNDLKKTEDKIASIEAEINLLNEEMAKEEVYSSPAESLKIHKKQTILNKELETLYELWDSLME